MYVNSTYFCTKRQAKKEIFEYIEFYYNRIRSHSYLGNLSPVKFEEKQEKEKVLQSEMVAYGLAKKCLFFSYLSIYLSHLQIILNTFKILKHKQIN